MISVTIEPGPPFDFDLSAAIFAVGDPRVRIFRNGIFRQALAAGPVPGILSIRSTGTTRRPAIVADWYSGEPAGPETRAIVQETASRIFSTGDDPGTFYTAVSADPVMATLTRRLHGLRCPATPTFFEALIDSVIEQQISLPAARSIENRLIKAVGKPVPDDDGAWYCYPAPEELAEVPDPVFRSCGLTIRKGEYIRGIARQVCCGDLDLEKFRNYGDTESIIEELRAIRGIGRWTAELAILRGLHRPDAFPADDIGVRRFISRFYYQGEKVSSETARKVSTQWGAFAGFAAYYLEVAELLRIGPGELELAGD